MTQKVVIVDVAKRPDGWYVTVTPEGEGTRYIGPPSADMAAAAEAAVEITRLLASHLEDTFGTRTELKRLH